MTSDGSSAARITEHDDPSTARRPVTNIALRGRRLVPLSKAKHRGEPLDSSCVLPGFVAGPENELLSRVLGDLIASVANQPFAAAATPQGPITLVGPSGCGKTHLAHGLAELWHHRFGGRNAAARATENQPQSHRGVAYLTATDFARQLADAIEDGAVNQFRQQLRSCGLLVIDDLDRLSPALHLQEELLHTIDSLTTSGGLIVFAAAVLPADTPALGRPLVSRLSEGVVVEIAPLGVEARSELLRQIATTLGCHLNDEALATLAARLPGEPPRLISAGVELRRRFGPRINSQDAARFLDDSAHRQSPGLRDILAAAARYYGVTQKMLTSASRRQTVVLARAVAIFLARRMTPLTYQEIGQALGGRDHTTVLHNFRRIENALPKDRALRSALEEVERAIAKP